MTTFGSYFYRPNEILTLKCKNSKILRKGSWSMTHNMSTKHDTLSFEILDSKNAKHFLPNNKFRPRFLLVFGTARSLGANANANLNLIH